MLASGKSLGCTRARFRPHSGAIVVARLTPRDFASFARRRPIPPRRELHFFPGELRHSLEDAAGKCQPKQAAGQIIAVAGWITLGTPVLISNATENGSAWVLASSPKNKFCSPQKSKQSRRASWTRNLGRRMTDRPNVLWSPDLRRPRREGESGQVRLAGSARSPLAGFALEPLPRSGSQHSSPFPSWRSPVALISDRIEQSVPVLSPAKGKAVNLDPACVLDSG